MNCVTSTFDPGVGLGLIKLATATATVSTSCRPRPLPWPSMFGLGLASNRSTSLSRKIVNTDILKLLSIRPTAITNTNTCMTTAVMVARQSAQQAQQVSL